MKHKLYAFLLCLTCILLLVVPGYAQALETLHAGHECTDHVHEVLERVPDQRRSARVTESATSEQTRIQLANAKKMQTCAHEKAISYYDSETKVSGYVCPNCSAKWENTFSLASSAKIITNAATRKACSHQFSSWGFFNSSVHTRVCSLCAATEYGVHELTEVSCTQNEYCTVCNSFYEEWAEAWGHDMGYYFCIDDFIRDGTYRHEYRCLRIDEEWEFICDYVEVSEFCDFDIDYIDPAVNGRHECYNVCNDCYSTGNITYVDCTMALAGRCSWCRDVNPWS